MFPKISDFVYAYDSLPVTIKLVPTIYSDSIIIKRLTAERRREENLRCSDLSLQYLRFSTNSSDVLSYTNVLDGGKVFDFINHPKFFCIAWQSHQMIHQRGKSKLCEVSVLSTMQMSIIRDLRHEIKEFKRIKTLCSSKN